MRNVDESERESTGAIGHIPRTVCGIDNGLPNVKPPDLPPERQIASMYSELATDQSFAIASDGRTSDRATVGALSSRAPVIPVAPKQPAKIDCGVLPRMWEFSSISQFPPQCERELLCEKFCMQSVCFWLDVFVTKPREYKKKSSMERSARQRRESPKKNGHKFRHDMSDTRTTTDEEEEPGVTRTKDIPQGSDRVPDMLKRLLIRLPQKWRNALVRSIFGFVMISLFSFIIYVGPIGLIVLILAIQVKCFQEIISIGHSVYRIHGLPWFRSLSWYFLLTTNYFFYGENVLDFFGGMVDKVEYLNFLVKYHRFLSFSMYCGGFMWFVLSLVKKYYLKQFSLFAWTHVALLIVVTQSYLIIQNVFQGLIWFLTPVSMIICNDLMAYFFGLFFGRTPLIKLSPKKTWEGFIGGGIATVFFGAAISWCLCHSSYFTCPVEYDESLGRIVVTTCKQNYLFTMQEVEAFGWQFTIFPFMIHALWLSIFSAVIGPFGGFFASGFKRAFKIKDFGDVIPGHGGIMDRFDCQFLMATFVNVYISSFIRTASPAKLLSQVFTLKPEQQVQFYNSLRDHLEDIGIL